MLILVLVISCIIGLAVPDLLDLFLWAVHIDTQFRQVLILKIIQAAFVGLFLRLVICPQVLKLSVNGSISPGKADSQL